MGNNQTKSDLEKLYEKYPDFPKNQKLFGLENFGNTCYCNSVLQVLYFCVPFRNKILQYYCELKGLPPVVINNSNENNNNNNNNNNNSNNDTNNINNDSMNSNNNNSDNNNNNQNSNDSNNSNSSSGSSGSSSTSYFKNMFNFFGISGSSVNNNNNTNNNNNNNNSYGQSSSFSSSYNNSRNQEKEGNLIINLGELFYTIHQNKETHGCLKPETFVERLKKENELFSSFMHQDAHEFLNFLLNSIAEFLQKQQKNKQPQQSSEKKEFKTLVHEIFEGTLTNETKCLTCESITNKDESFLDLSIDIEQNKSLTNCLSNFSSIEILSKNDKFFCDQCNSLQEAQKRMKIKKLPNTLIIHLKRFKYMENIQQYTKLNYRVVFPFEIIIQNTTSNIDEPDKKFNLFAVVIHVGSGPNHGHYYSLIKCHGVWFVFDDHHIDIREESDIYDCFGSSNEFNNDCSYLLFYQCEDSSSNNKQK
ncbi:hypothetical protein ACTFIT_001528 [Dictyostelium discoideum]